METSGLVSSQKIHGPFLKLKWHGAEEAVICNHPAKPRSCAGCSDLEGLGAELRCGLFIWGSVST